MPDNTVSGAGGSAGASQLDNLEYVGEGRVKFSNGSTMSVMEALSFLFLERAETYSQLTKDKMQETQDNLNQIKEAREMLQKARDAKAQASKKHSTDAGSDFNDYCTKYGISQKDSDDNTLHHSDQWDAVIEGVQARLDSLTDSNQMKFLEVKSTANKLEESFTAANKYFDQSFETIKTILR